MPVLTQIERCSLVRISGMPNSVRVKLLTVLFDDWRRLIRELMGIMD